MSRGAHIFNWRVLISLPLSLHPVAYCAGGNLDVVQVMQVSCDPVGRISLVENPFENICSYVVRVFGVRWHVRVDKHEQSVALLALPRDLFVPEDPLDGRRAKILHVMILVPAADNLVAAAGDTFSWGDVLVRDHFVLGVRDGRILLILHEINSGPKSLNSSARAAI